MASKTLRRERMTDEGPTSDARCDKELPLHLVDTRPTMLLITGAPTEAFDHWPGRNAVRFLAPVPAADARTTLDHIIAVDLVVLFHTNGAVASGAAERNALLHRLGAMAATGMFRLLVVTDLRTLDEADRALGPDALLLCEPASAELHAALDAALDMGSAPRLLNDIGGDTDAARIDRLSEEVERLAHMLDALTRDMLTNAKFPRATPAAPRLSDRMPGYMAPPRILPAHVGDPGENTLTAAQVRDILRARRLRDHFLPGDLFADPAWDMLLDLMAARLEGERVSVSSLCIAAAVPPTTALRWIRQLTERGVFRREADPADGRRIFIVLSDEAATAVTEWFAARRRLLRDDTPPWGMGA